MLSYCLKGEKEAETKKPRFERTTNGRKMVLSNCSISNSKKRRFIKEQKASGLLNSLGIKTPLVKFL